MFATTHPGLEGVLATELTALGAAGLAPEPGGVAFEGHATLLTRANLELRTAGRVTLRIGSFHAGAFHELERHAQKIPWERFLAPGVAAHFRVTAKKSKLYHERAIVERLAAAVGARCADVAIVASRGEAGDDEQAGDRPVQRFIVRLHRDECLISADTSGSLLHRRGYRTAVAKAPLRETLAAGLLLLAGYDGTIPLVDPLCGSGTLPIEAAMIARRIAPGLERSFAFERWPDADLPATERHRSELREAMLVQAPAAIVGADRDAGAIVAARANAERAGVAIDIEWREAAVSSLMLPEDRGLIVTNPPYGARIGDRAALRNLYAQFGNVLRQRAAGWQVALLSADRMLEGQTRLPWREAAATENGGLRVRALTTRLAPA